MQRTVFSILALIAGLGAPAPAQNVTALVDVSVLPMDSERVLEHRTVIVRDGRIARVAPAAALGVPAAATRIDGTGKYLMPGLAEMHGHVPGGNAPEELVEAVLFLYLSNGITTVRGMLGAPGQLELRARANRGEILSPTLYLAGPSFNGRSINSPREAIDKVRKQKAEGWNLLKVHPGLTLDEYNAMASTANDLGVRFGGHVPADVGIAQALESGQETIDHLDGYLEHLEKAEGDRDRILADLAARTRGAGAWVVPTMALWETLLGVGGLEERRAYPELKYLPRRMVNGWIEAFNRRTGSPDFDLARMEEAARLRRKLLGVFNGSGVRILLGTDAPQQFSVPGFSIHREMKVMAECGMTPYEIIRSGTRNVGAYFANEDDFGTIQEGKRADFILLDSNPFQDIAHIADRAGVMVRGRWISEQEIQTRLAEIAARFARPSGSEY